MSGCYLMVAYGADPTFLSACDQTLQIVLRACRFITPTFMLIALLYTVGRGFLSGHGLSMDWGPILKAVWIFFLLFFYQELIDTLSSGVANFTRLFATPDGSTAASALGATISSADTLSQKTVVEQGVDEISNLLKTITSFSLTNILLQLVTGEVVLLIRQIMQFIQQFILGFLFVCGPISICLSVIPSFGQLAMKWLQNFLAVQFWGLSFALLDLLYTYYTSSNTTFGGVFAGPAAVEQDTKQLVVSVAFIMLYLMVPYLTSLIIGSSAAQSFVGSVVGMAASAAAAGAGVSAGMNGGGHGVSGAIGRAMGGGSKAAGGSAGGGGGDGGGSSGGGTPAPSGGSSASAGLPTITMSDALNPSYRQRPSGLWTV
ncbi:conjugal transfer protein TraG N-terminal domain-containing protein [Hymenobacter sp. J193]|uniref:conjugal transfer protein TraG N-terminal domain-containing protein n=1 Tax=Hymenobacter sp. J193 TaxID=2898429 RepID=UPI002151C4EA|nr:conjugal transfer protein TraG N-terminal domain-containing protein [Hymenobacter sp. J193]MCR5890574.1 conjugal transfer protein TraG N-terminal domain-containing protein [Hymenobacter sp. J193]